MTLNVLIVDDEPLIRKGLTTMIDWSLYGFSVMGEFSNGEDALAYLSENPNQVDVILTDIRMPGMDGLELIKRVKEIATKEIYFVILSGYYEFEYAKKAIQYQVKDYLLKPIQADDLIEILKKINVDYMQQVKEEIEVNTRKK
ncbi:MAG TPA: response regulator, partial [Candidatus Jeotgalibaca merdavium]|nr:response regulator [Candidatus Jeotgalibaca merdavium]